MESCAHSSRTNPVVLSLHQSQYAVVDSFPHSHNGGTVDGNNTVTCPTDLRRHASIAIDSGEPSSVARTPIVANTITDGRSLCRCLFHHVGKLHARTIVFRCISKRLRFIDQATGPSDRTSRLSQTKSWICRSPSALRSGVPVHAVTRMGRRGQNNVIALHWVPIGARNQRPDLVELTPQSAVKTAKVHSSGPLKTRRLEWGLERRRNIAHWTSRILCFRFPRDNSTHPGPIHCRISANALRALM